VSDCLVHVAVKLVCINKWEIAFDLYFTQKIHKQTIARTTKQ
jgi:hypothetical protein